MYQATAVRNQAGEDWQQQLREEIATLECRLEDMGMDGDCAYERAMSRLYTTMVEDRKRQLAALPLARPA
jgi:ketosteroid isomerase-like protein